MSKTLSGVIAAVATPIEESGAPDLARAIKLARYLLDNGCDGLNVLGTTGEATSFSLEERKARDERLQGARPAARPPDGRHRRRRDRRMRSRSPVMPPNSALPARWCCRRSTTRACPTTGSSPISTRIVKATAEKPIPIYLYHFPAMSGLPWHVALIKRLLRNVPRPHRRA